MLAHISRDPKPVIWVAVGEPFGRSTFKNQVGENMGVPGAAPSVIEPNGN